MPIPECPRLTPDQEEGLKRAVEGTCELCSRYFAFQFLEIHRISRRRYREMIRDPSTRILVACRDCHRQVHRIRLRVKEQRALVACRPFFVRQDMRRILGYRPKRYMPPLEPELSVMYDEYFFHFPPGSFRLGG
jgi:hypothetical protein